MDDWLLLSRYVESGCQDSFEQIVTRHSGWVFSLSLRAVRDRHLAEDVTQAVFIVLARKARTIRQGTPLSGWLFKVSRFAVSDALKRRTRIKNRENRFAEFFKATGNGNATALESDNISDTVSQTLDEAVACLSESDRQIVLLRFYEHKSLAEIGTILEISEEAAKKRVARAVERLRKYFSTRGIIASVALLLLLLSNRSAEAASLGAVFGTAAAPSIANSIAEGAIQLMAHANARLLGAILAAGLALLIAVPTLGGALVRGIVATTAPTTVEVQPAKPANIASSTEPQRTIELPAEARFADVWIGYKGELLWRSDAYSGPKPTPFILQQAEKLDKPYAVALDNKGNFFLKSLDRSFLQSPVIRQATFDYDNGPIDRSARVESMMSTIELMPPGGGGGGGSGDAGSGSSSDSNASSERRHSRLLPKIDERKADDDWRKLNHEQQGDGTYIVNGLSGSTLSIPQSINHNAGLNFDLGGLNDVPEPSACLLVLGGTTLLALRRRRRQ